MSQNRPGRTTVTSVSLSKEFKDILIKHGFSPTDVMRKGIAVSLYEAGESRYMTEMNRNRYEAITSFLKSSEIIDTLNFLEDKIKEIKKSLSLVDSNEK